MNHNITLTDGQKLALELDMADVVEFIDNWVNSRLDIAANTIRNADWYGEAVAGVVADGGDPVDPFVVVLKARTLGLVETAQERADRLASEAPPISGPSPEEIIASRVNGHAIVLKVDAVNALRTDGGEPFPVSSAGIVLIRDNYTDRINELSAKTLIGDTLTAEEVAEVSRIKAGFAFFKGVDTAAQAIITAGDPADPIEADPRWPTPPTP